MDHVVQWYSPAPLWPNRLENGARDRMQQPALLEFQQDDFMQALTGALTDTPPTLSGNVARRTEEESGEYSQAGGTGLPLYQPAHERYYLVTASLVCRQQGLPDRTVKTANEERTTFVLRRLERADSEASKELLADTDEVNVVKVNDETYVEYAWMKTEPAVEGGEGAENGDTKTAKKTREWRPLKAPKEQVPKKEERLAMFPKTYEPTTPGEQMKGTRRLWSGLIPVAKRDTYETAPVRRAPVDPDATRADEQEKEISDASASRSLPSDESLGDPRMTKFDTQILGAFRQINKLLGRPKSSVTAADVRDPIVFAWYDFWEFLGAHLPDVQQSIAEEERAEDARFQARTDGDRDNRVRRKKALIRVLNAAYVPEMGLGVTAADALRTVGAPEHRKAIESGDLDQVLDPDDLPQTDAEELDREGLQDAFSRRYGDGLLETEIASEQGKEPEEGEKEPAVKTVVNRALDPLDSVQSLPDDLQPPTSGAVGEGTYIVRCLYERPKCPEPQKTQLSEASRLFQLASFFDAQAPSRDISITLPSASLKDLRDSDQSVTMVFKKELRRQAERLQDMTLESLQDGDVGEAPKVNLGMVCSLSIPIITICALALLLVMVTLLNIVFWWLPFFKICFPLPSGE